MAEEEKNQLPDEPAEAADSVAEDNPSAGAEQDPQSAEGNEADPGTSTGDVKSKSIDPQNQAFWEDSVDANSVNLSEGETPQEEAAKKEETDSTATTPSPQDEAGESDGENQPTEQEPAPAQDAQQEETPKAEESTAGDTEPAEDTPVAEEASQPEAGEEETPTAKTEEAEEASTTPPPQDEAGESDGEIQPTEQEPAPAQDEEQEGTQKDTDVTDTESEETQGKGKVISIYEYLRKKRLLTGIGILLLVAGSIGYAVTPGLRSPGSFTSTLLGGIPETAYNMKFFLPLNVGYEKAQFVKVTIALELIDEGLQKELDKNLSNLRKEVIDLILTKSPKEVRSADGKRELSREITRRINNFLSKDCIKDTYFTELVIL